MMRWGEGCCQGLSSVEQRMKLQRLPHNRYTRLQEQWVVVSALICVQLWLA